MKATLRPAKADTGFDLCSVLAPLASLLSLFEQILAFFGIEVDILSLLGCEEPPA